jgi:hypothetical protein
MDQFFFLSIEIYIKIKKSTKSWGGKTW